MKQEYGYRRGETLGEEFSSSCSEIKGTWCSTLSTYEAKKSFGRKYYKYFGSYWNEATYTADFTELFCDEIIKSYFNGFSK